MLIQKIEKSPAAKIEEQLCQVAAAREALAQERFGNGVTVWRGQIEGAGEVRSVLPATAYGSREAASLYAMHANYRSLARAGDEPFVMPAVLRPKRIFATATPDDADPFVDLDVIAACFGRDAAERMARELAGHIQDTNAFEEISAETASTIPRRWSDCGRVQSSGCLACSCTRPFASNGLPTRCETPDTMPC